jgi:hypothetical protein
MAIGARFPNRSETARYIFAQLLTENRCLVCGHAAPEAAKGYITRIDSKHCVVCGSDISKDDWAEPTALADKRVEKTTEELAATERDSSESRRSLGEAERRY